jgi:hypothetical protein
MGDSWSVFCRSRALACAGLLWGVGAQAHADVQLQCAVTYAGETQTVLADPVRDPYPVAAVDVRKRFRFKAVLVGEHERVDRVNLYVYQHTPQQPVLVQQAKYLPPFDWPAHGQPLRLTGVQHLYAGALERELIYSCQLHRGRP